MHPNLCAVYAVHRLYSAFFSIQLQYSTLPAMISFSRLIMVLQMMVVSETVVISWSLRHWSKIAYDLIIRGLSPDSVSVLLKINPVNLHWKNRNTEETYFCIGMSVI